MFTILLSLLFIIRLKLKSINNGFIQAGMQDMLKLKINSWVFGPFDMCDSKLDKRLHFVFYIYASLTLSLAKIVADDQNVRFLKRT